jgi:ATP-dependent DNA ligase
MNLPLRRTLLPMEARSVGKVPVGPEWQYEPKWDGFRCLVFRDGDRVDLQSKSAQPLARYFPDLVEVLLQLRAKTFVLDGEIVVPIDGRLSFDHLLQRIHPAASRVAKLASEHPAMLLIFDLLVDDRGKSLLKTALSERRKKLEAFAKKHLVCNPQVRLSPATTNLTRARRWFAATGGNLDGIVAKRLDLPYRAGERDGMQKVKHQQTADCVVGGFRYAAGKKVVGSLLLGLYDEQGLLNHVGFSASFTAHKRRELTKLVEPLIGGPGFTGKAPGGPSRWSTRRSSEWQRLKPTLVVEVTYDHFSEGRFRHGTRFIRFRPDKSPRQCTYEQVNRGKGSSLRLLRG